MPISHLQVHAPTAPRTYAGCEKGLPVSFHDDSGTEIAHDDSRVSPFARILKGAIALVIVLSTVWWFSSPQFSAPHGNDPTITLPIVPGPRNYARAPAPFLLEVFQIHPPVLTVANNGALQITDDSTKFGSQNYDQNHAICEKVLVVHSFGYSYGHPFIGNYTPPTCKFSRVTWNLTVVSAGRQFDRLGIVYLGDIEVFRTSTAEPTASGIIWTYLKDMTNYLSLFKKDQKLIFDLGNLIDDVYTGAFNVTLTAAFFTAESSAKPADLILPVSKDQAAEDMASAFDLSKDAGTSSLTIPRNTKKAVFTIAATGQSNEEFWWSNVLQSETQTFPQNGPLPGYSPFREVQLYIDGSLAGVAWPFPIIFTGGVVPGLWRPIVGIDAFDLKEDEIDITPWLPLLCDGNPHSFEIRVTGLNDNGNGTASLSETTDDYWIVSGKIFLWLDASGHITTGQGPRLISPPPDLQVTSSLLTSRNNTNSTLLYYVAAQRTLSLQSTLIVSSGSQTVSWHQNRTFSNTGNLSASGNIAINTQKTTGHDVSSSGYSRDLAYDLYAYSDYETLGSNISIAATVNRAKTVETKGQAVFPSGLEAFVEVAPWFQGSLLSTTQNGSATYLANTTSSKSFSFGTTEQDMTLSGIRDDRGYEAQGAGETELFYRHALAVNGTVPIDEERVLGGTMQHAHGNGHGYGDDQRGFCLNSLHGRGGKRHGGHVGL
ncbi:hypothetical protein MBLNU13_g03040t1 [Cladosporium sp. NU13]